MTKEISLDDRKLAFVAALGALHESIKDIPEGTKEGANFFAWAEQRAFDFAMEIEKKAIGGMTIAAYQLAIERYSTKEETESAIELLIEAHRRFDGEVAASNTIARMIHQLRKKLELRSGK